MLRWVPHSLTAEQKQKRLNITTLLKERFSVENQAFLRRTVPIDETRIWDFEPELKYSPTSGELQVPLGHKNFDELNQKSSD